MAPKTPEQNEEIRKKTRQRIIDAAFKKFAQEGYSRTSVSAVAKKAGISKGLIYHYFESKEAILGAIFDQLVDVGDEILNLPDYFTPAGKMRQMLERTFEFIKEQTGTGRLTISLALQPEATASLKPKLEQANKTQMALYIKIFEELGYDKPELEAYRLGALMDGLLLGYATMGDDYPFDEMKSKIMEEYVPS
jgi:AcrR family transcriptional regulator